MYDLTVSIVLYNTEESELRSAVDSLFATDLVVRLCLVDNSAAPTRYDWLQDDRVDYIFSGRNLGYGTAHNVALRRYLNCTKYHLILNADTRFGPEVLPTLLRFMESHPEVGHVMPKIVYPDGNIQYVCKLLPTPANLFLRRFWPWRDLVERRNDVYELRFTGYDGMMDVPHLSGCFMFLRCSALREVGLFDEKFFVYAEDIDLSRRMHHLYRTVFLPEVSVIHKHHRSSYKSKKLLFIHIWSIIRYFNKWGWFQDHERANVNKMILDRIMHGVSKSDP